MDIPRSYNAEAGCPATPAPPPGFEVFNEYDKPPTPVKKPVKLRLVPSPGRPGRVLVVAVDDAGKELDGGIIVAIGADGIRLSSGVAADIGIALRDRRAVVTNL